MHTREDETFYVVEGELEFVVAERIISASAGSVVYCPRSIPHGFRNVGTTPSRTPVIITPAGLEKSPHPRVPLIRPTHNVRDTWLSQLWREISGGFAAKFTLGSQAALRGHRPRPYPL